MNRTAWISGKKKKPFIKKNVSPDCDRLEQVTGRGYLCEWGEHRNLAGGAEAKYRVIRNGEKRNAFWCGSLKCLEPEDE